LKKLESELEYKLDITILGTIPGKNILKINDIEYKVKGAKCLNSFKSLVFKLVNPKLFFSYFKYYYILDADYGDAYSDIYGVDTFNGLNFTKIFFRLINKPQLLLPQTIGPYKDEVVRKQAIKSINSCHTVLTRDKLSKDYVLKNTNQKNVFELIDIAFFMPYKPDKLDKSCVNVGIGISALLWRGGYTGKNELGLKNDYQDLIRNIISSFLKRDNVRIYLVPHVVMGDHHIENDYVVSKDIVTEFNDIKLLLSPFFITPIDAKNFISGLDFFTGSRMHACIAAFSSGVPVFPIGYSRKFNGLFEDTLDYGYMGDLLTENSEDIIKKLNAAFEDRHKLSEIIDQRMNSIVKERYNILMEKLKQFLIS
jgi:polysaccharide pyruvyl transferase WcaK-like protein